MGSPAVGEEYVAHVLGADGAEHFACAGDALAAAVEDAIDAGDVS